MARPDPKTIRNVVVKFVRKDRSPISKPSKYGTAGHTFKGVEIVPRDARAAREFDLIAKDGSTVVMKQWSDRITIGGGSVAVFDSVGSYYPVREGADFADAGIELVEKD